MKPSCCDVKIQFNFITDPMHFISLGAKLLHRAAIAHIVLRWTDSLQIYCFGFLGEQTAPIVARWEPSCCDGNADFLHFLGFFLSFCILDSVLMLFPVFVGFPSYLGMSWSFYY
ncbi:hypothetical protein QL285_086926 [Trifolium repens]|nr:hypothetical protein QL285_086926 [Trifolium repens]